MTTIITNNIIYIQQITSSNPVQYQIDTIFGPWTDITSWPVTIANGINVPTSNITVSFTTNITLSNISNYFICGTGHITFDGSTNIVNISGITNYLGLIQNGTNSTNGFSNITVQNCAIVSSGSTIAQNAGWVCQSYFASNAINNIIDTCSSNGNMDGIGSGGICGSYAGNNSGPNTGALQLTIMNCRSSGNINGAIVGGICGSFTGASSNPPTNDGNQVAITNCSSTGQINGNASGGICGTQPSQTTIMNCSSYGQITGQDAGGICGSYASTQGLTTILNCSSFGDINGSNAGGICGSNSGTANPPASCQLIIQKCYSVGVINNYGAGGIVGSYFGSSSNSTCTIINCYSIGDISGNLTGGIVGFSMGFYNVTNASINITNCYSLGVIGSSSGGICAPVYSVPGSENPTPITFTNCYSYGQVIDAGSGLIASGSNLNITINNCYIADNLWSDADANNALTGFPTSIYTNNPATAWTTVAANTPYILSVFNAAIYSPNSTIQPYQNYVSDPGLFTENTNTYYLISVNNAEPPSTITINPIDGVLSFSNFYMSKQLIYAEKVFVSSGTGPYYYGYNFNTFTLTLSSDVCFPADTPIKTDQGIIAIDRINPKIHTIKHKRILAITKTISREDYLVCFEKNALGMNYPSAKTVISQKHKIYYDGQMINARKFLGKFAKVSKVDYNGEFLYNVLMADHNIIRVNNFICETLNPSTVVAKIYKLRERGEPTDHFACPYDPSLHVNHKKPMSK